ncbi:PLASMODESMATA CALLOSE-BINDING PROTEIN 1 [Cajanus cajan]|uniref:Glucan endo-1,3-beta-glucosidase 7 n=1 Tax=Cajanus cajan TaxID=3821 RepID=A0A151R5C6_CAJCA|nr:PLASMODESMATA CALLOSE-BINDING PROTEIN 1 [Cajanus cajan]KYP37788.1 Glucan endo-1,3-beta-glucosidase 7 [Cajanus cajan]
MGIRSWHLVLFSMCLFFSSGLSRDITFREEENQEISYDFDTKLDAVPIVNPTTPGTANPYPTLNPTTPQAPNTIGQTPSTPTTPYMTPTNPTSPTSPKTSPTTNPYANPTTPTSPTTTTPTTPTTPTTASGGGQWCVASQSAAESTLKVALDYACGYGADCSAIQPGANCYNPNTLKDHASYAFNDYYQKNPAPTSCAFGGTATLTNKDPSNGNCRYTSSKTPSMSPPTYVSPPTPPTPTSTMTPTPPSTMIPATPGIMTPSAPGMTTIPGGASVYGSGPTGSPNIATSALHSELLLFTLFGLWASLHVENYM